MPVKVSHTFCHPEQGKAASKGSDGSAASGGRSDLSEWQRSARDEGQMTEDIRWEPQQDSSHYRFCIVGGGTHDATKQKPVRDAPAFVIILLQM